MSWLDASWGGRWAGEACSTVAVVTGPPAAQHQGHTDKQQEILRLQFRYYAGAA